MKIEPEKYQRKNIKEFLWLKSAAKTTCINFKKVFRWLYKNVLCYLAVRLQPFGYTKCSRPKPNKWDEFESRVVIFCNKNRKLLKKGILTEDEFYRLAYMYGLYIII